MKTIDYEDKKEHVNTEGHIAVDEAMDKKFGNIQRAYNEGFAASDGVRAGTAETDGRVTVPEASDEPSTKRTPESLRAENPGLADN